MVIKILLDELHFPSVETEVEGIEKRCPDFLRTFRAEKPHPEHNHNLLVNEIFTKMDLDYSQSKTDPITKKELIEWIEQELSKIHELLIEELTFQFRVDKRITPKLREEFELIKLDKNLDNIISFQRKMYEFFKTA